jgi:hypothetical protein
MKFTTNFKRDNLTILEQIIAENNLGWSVESFDLVNRGKTPVGAYFMYQKQMGHPKDGGTQPLWSYNLSQLIKAASEFGGRVFDHNGKILKTSINHEQSNTV